MKKRSDKNSATSAVAGFVGAINDRIPLPAGVELRSEAELIIWHQFTRARARSDWRDMDLILLAKIVKMEADIRAAQIELDAMGMMIENKRGTPIPNQLLSVIDTLERRQLAVIRSMSLNQTASDPRTINGSAKVEGEARAALRALSESTTLPSSILEINFCDIPNPVSFRYFKTSPDIIQLAVMLSVRFSLSRISTDLISQRASRARYSLTCVT